MPRPDDDNKSPSKELAPEKAKDTRGEASGGSEKKEVAKLNVEAVVDKIVAGEMLIETALAQQPGLIPALQKRFGNAAVAELMDADKKVKKDEKDAKNAGDEGKKGASAKGGGGDGGEAKKGGEAKGGGAIGKGAADIRPADIGPKGNVGGDAKGAEGKKGDLDPKKAEAPKDSKGGLTGKLMDKVKEKHEKGGDDDKGAEGKGAEGKGGDAKGKDGAGGKDKGAGGKEEKGKGDEAHKDTVKKDPNATKEDKAASEVKKGQDPTKKVDEAVKKATEKKDDGATKDVGKDAGKDGGKDAGKVGEDPKKAADNSKKDDDLKKVVDQKDKSKNDDNKGPSGGSKGTADQVLDKAKDVSSKKVDAKDAATKLGDATKDAKGDGGKDAKGGGAKDGKGDAGKGDPGKDSKTTEVGKDGKGGDAKKGSDGKDPQKDGGAKDDKGAAGKDGKGAEGKDGGKEGTAEPGADEKGAADKSPAAKDAQKAKGDADKAPDAKDGGGGKEGGKEGGGGEGAKDEKGGGAPGKEGPAPDAGAGGGDAGKEGPAPAGGGGGGGAAPAIKEKSLDDYLKSHPDKAAEDRVTNVGFQNDKIGRDANELKANVAPPPDKSWLSAVDPRAELFNLKKSVMGPNKWTGQDRALDVMTRINGALDSIGGAAGKIGLAATIGGAILTFLIPPVGAFLLAVGRVANAIQLACSAFRIVTSIITTVMLAVKAAKEKDPIKRLEMMQEMKANVQAGVMAGIDVIMSKIGGKAKGAAGAGAGKGMSAAKAAFAEARAAGKGILASSGAAIKEGAKAFVGGIKTSFKEGIAGIKGQIAMAKELGVGGTLKAIGKSAYSGTVDALKETFVTPFKDMKSAFTSCLQFKQNWRDFRSMITQNGGGFSGYRQTIMKINFPNFGGANWKEKAKSVFKDMTNTSAGGYASQVAAGIKGTEAKTEYQKNADGSIKTDAHGRQMADQSASKNAGTVLAEKQREKLAKLEAALASNNDVAKRKALNDGKTTDGALSEELHHQGEQGNDVKKRLDAYKNGIGTADRGQAYTTSGGATESNLDWRLKQEIEKTKKSFNVLMPASYGGMAMDVGKSVIGGGGVGDVAKTAIGHAGPVGKTTTKFMVNQTSQQDKDKKKKSLFEEAAEKNEANTKAAVGQVPTMLKDGSWANLTANKVNAATSPAMQLVAKRESELASSMVQTGPKTASAPAPQGPTGGAGPGAVDAGAKAQPPAPPPPAPPEGTLIPDISLLGRIGAERTKLDGYEKSVKKDVSDSEEIKTQAIGADKAMAKYATGLDKQATDIGKEKGEATKDIGDIAKAKGDITKGGADVAANKSKAEGEKSKTEAKASEGKGVANPQVDDAKKRAEEKKKSDEEKAAWDRDYNSSGWLRRRYLDAKKLIGGVFSWIAKAAAWVWNNIIKVAIEAVKKAVAKVIGFITDLMMKGIMSIVKCFLSEEEGARLDSTMAQMKELEAKQAKAATEEGEKTNKDAKMKLTGAQASAKAKIDHAQGNITTGKGLLDQIGQNRQVLDKEEADVKAKNDAFKAQYGPYFDWAAKQDKEKAGGGGAAPGGPGKEGAQDKGGDPGKAGGDAGGKKEGGGATDKGTEVKTGGAPANAGKDEGKKEHPADKKLDPQVGQALAIAVSVVLADSKQSMADVANASSKQSGKVTKVSDAVTAANIQALVQAATKMKADGQQGDPGSFIADEKSKGEAVRQASSNVGSQVVNAHAVAEMARQGRLQQLLSQANGISGLSLSEALKVADQIAKELAKEAAAIDGARMSAMDELATGYGKAMGK